MYSGDTNKKHRITSGYLARPKLGVLKNFFTSSKPTMKPLSGYGLEKKKKNRKPNVSKMEYRKRPDYADTAYREAVSRLRILLAESYTPIKKPIHDLDSAGEETDNQSINSGISRRSRYVHGSGLGYYQSAVTPRRYNFYQPSRPPTFTSTELPEKALPEPHVKLDPNPPPELMSFIERQEDYIEQLERESRFCREELSSLLGKVKDVITENENLHEKQKTNLIKSVFDQLETETETENELEGGKIISKSQKPRKRVLEGPSIVFESRISELEAQLIQTKIELKKAQEENESFKRKMADGTIADGFSIESYKKQIESLQRERNVAQDTVSKLQSTLAQLRDKENSASDQMKRSLDVAEQAQYEKATADHEIRRLKDEVERQHGKLRDAIAEQSRRVAEERNTVERRFNQQIEQLQTDLAVQWETTSKLQLELDKQRRENTDSRRELAQKQALIDELKKEMQNKISSLQSDIGVTGAEKSALEQQISTLQISNERSERQGKQEVARMQVELQSLRQRLDRADADLIHSRRENVRLNEQIAALEKEININTALNDERTKRDVIALPPPKEDREKELSSMVHDIESKHAATVAELEGMIHSQNQLMDKLSNECHALTQKLEDASTRHKEEIRELQTNLSYLTNRLNQSQIRPPIYQGEGHNNVSQSKLALSQQNVQDSTEHPTAPELRNLTNVTSSEEPSVKYEPAVSPQTPTSNPQQSPKNMEQNIDIHEKTEPIASEINNDMHTEDVTLGEQPSNNSNNNPNHIPQESLNDPNYYNQQYQYDPNNEYNQTYTNEQYDPNQQYDPNTQSYDPNQYDQNQTYDPNQQYMTQEEYEQQYGPYDPNVQYSEDANQQDQQENYEQTPKQEPQLSEQQLK